MGGDVSSEAQTQFVVRKRGQAGVKYGTGVFPADALPDGCGAGVYGVSERGAGGPIHVFKVDIAPDGVRHITQVG